MPRSAIRGRPRRRLASCVVSLFLAAGLVRAPAAGAGDANSTVRVPDRGVEMPAVGDSAAEGRAAPRSAAPLSGADRGASSPSAAASKPDPDGEPDMNPGVRAADAPQGGESHAPGALSAAGLSGSLRAGYWSSDRRLDDTRGVGTAQAWARLDRKIGSAVAVFAEGYVAGEDGTGDRRTAGRVREGYLDGRLGPLDVRLGKQIVAWGRADRLNPTDNLTPRDFTLLAPEVDEDRFGSLAAKGAWTLAPGASFTALWLPQFRPHVIPLPVTPGFAFAERLPKSSRQSAFKFDTSGGTIDWSLSWYDGFDLNPDLSPGASAQGLRTIELDHHRIQVAGFDVASTRGAYRFAAEIAYTRTEAPAGGSPYFKNPFWYGVVGVERDFVDDLSLIVQVFERQVSDYRDPRTYADSLVQAIAIQQAVLSSQYDRSQQGLTARIAKKWLNQTLEGEIAASSLVNRSGYALRPKLSYAISDNWRITGGADWYGGADTTAYGALRKNSAVFMELRWFP